MPQVGIAERRQREREEVRQKILDAARELFVTEGYDEVTMRKIAAKVEYSATAIYFHFRDKQALFRELCSQDFLSLARAFEKLGKIADPIERLRKTGYAYVDFALKHPQHYRLMFMTKRPDAAEVEADLSNKGVPQRDAYCFLNVTVKEALAAGRFVPSATDPELVAQTIWGCVHGVIALHLTMADDDWVKWRPVRKTATLAIDALIAGLTISA
jgi:AcrR family transcriptional regulator